MFTKDSEGIHSSDGFHISSIGIFSLTYIGVDGKFIEISCENEGEYILLMAGAFLGKDDENERVLQQCRHALEWAGYAVAISYFDGMQCVDGTIVKEDRGGY
jgi:hypothetical protein